MIACYLDHLITLHQRKYINGKKEELLAWEQRKFGDLVEKYEDPVKTPTEGYMRLGIRSHAKGTFHSYVEKGKELETAKMFRVAADKFIVNITFGWEHAVAITDEPYQFFNLKEEDWYFSFGPSFRFSIQQFPLRLLFANTFKIKEIGRASCRERV